MLCGNAQDRGGDRRAGVDVGGQGSPDAGCEVVLAGLGVGPRSVGHSIYDEVGTEIVVFPANDAG